MFYLFAMSKHCPKHLQNVPYFTLNVLLAFLELKEETMITEEHKWCVQYTNYLFDVLLLKDAVTHSFQIRCTQPRVYSTSMLHWALLL